MELQQARQLAFELMQKHGLIQQGWIFEFNNHKKGLGICQYTRKIIGMSKYFPVQNIDDEVKDTILHEIAHALVGAAYGHGWIWKMKCREIGAKPERCAKNAVMPKSRYMGVCPCCGYIYHMYRLKSKKGLPATFQNLVARGTWCGFCGREKGRIVWTDTLKNLTLYYVPPTNPNIRTLQDIIESASVRTYDTIPAIVHDTPPVYTQVINPTYPHVLNLVQVSSAEARSLQEAREMAKV